MIRIVLSSNHRFVKAYIRRMLSSEQDFEIVGEAETIPETLQLCTLVQPRILLIDVKYPDDAAMINDQVKDACPQLGTILLAAFDQLSSIHELLKAGIKGYLHHDEAFPNIVEAIRTVDDGGIWLSPAILCVPQTGHLAETHPDLLPSQREVEVIQLLGEGLSNPQLAQRLHVSERLVRFHLGNIMMKLHVKHRTETVSAAIRKGWINPISQAA